MLPVRDLGSVGVITDVDPFDLPLTAWSMGINVRFTEGRVIRGSVLRGVSALSASPRFISVNPGATIDTVFVGYKNGRVFKRDASGLTDYSIAGYVNSDAEVPWTSTTLGGVHYINREDRAPWALGPGATQFGAVTGWTSTIRTKLLRSYNGALVALNVTKSGVSYPRLAKFSDIIIDDNTQPPSWDHTDPTTNAIEFPLVDLAGQITDAAVLGTGLVVYSANDSVMLEADGSDTVYRIRKLPFNKGSINANCAVEYEGKHYVFGPNDLWVHDGISHQSIADGKIRRFVMRSMSTAKKDKCFVSVDHNTNEVSFCYVSGDQYINSTGSACNRAAVFNVSNNTWSFRDLPQVYAASLGNADAVKTWATAGTTWDTVGGTWSDQEGGVKRLPLYVGEASTLFGLTDNIYGLDVWGDGSVISAAVDTNATKRMLLERDGFDLDEVGAPLTGYKLLRAIYPQGRIESGAAAVEFQFGSSDHFNVPVTLTAWQTWDGVMYDRCDYIAAGRFLSMRVRFRDYKVLSLSGFDFDLDVLGE